MQLRALSIAARMQHLTLSNTPIAARLPPSQLRTQMMHYFPSMLTLDGQVLGRSSRSHRAVGTAGFLPLQLDGETVRVPASPFAAPTPNATASTRKVYETNSAPEALCVLLSAVREHLEVNPQMLTARHSALLTFADDDAPMTHVANGPGVHWQPSSPASSARADVRMGDRWRVGTSPIERGVSFAARPDRSLDRQLSSAASLQRNKSGLTREQSLRACASGIERGVSFAARTGSLLQLDRQLSSAVSLRRGRSVLQREQSLRERMTELAGEYSDKKQRVGHDASQPLDWEVSLFPDTRTEDSIRTYLQRMSAGHAQRGERSQAVPGSKLVEFVPAPRTPQAALCAAITMAVVQGGSFERQRERNGGSLRDVPQQRVSMRQAA